MGWEMFGGGWGLYIGEWNGMAWGDGEREGRGGGGVVVIYLALLCARRGGYEVFSPSLN